MNPVPQRRRRGRPPASESGAALTKEKIVDAALELIDANGLSAFSVRDVAKRLDVYHAAILWHVATKNQLLAEVVSHVLRDLQPPLSTGPWQDWIRELFRRYRQAIRAHPNIAPLIGAEMVSNAHIDFRLIETQLSALTSAGFTGQDLIDAFNVVTAAQVGFVTLEFAPPPPDAADQWSQDMQKRIHAVDPDEHPLLAEHIEQMANRAFTVRWQNGRDVPLDRGFDAYVETVVLGLEAIAARSRP
ncbi:MAG: TetR family transcriptional regulator [Sphingomonas sp.]|jgi:AcrR family transcriptional regulator|uniref:TetR family transcriptional regulator n=1 Tax=Sphingomonas sp. TaxID=28214 RepID=UPI00356A8A77